MTFLGGDRFWRGSSFDSLAYSVSYTGFQTQRQFHYERSIVAHDGFHNPLTVFSTFFKASKSDSKNIQSVEYLLKTDRINCIFLN